MALEVPLGLNAAARSDPFDRIYEAFFHPVCRWLLAMGIAEADLDDLAQEVFLVVQRKLAGFVEGNQAGWIYRIAANLARNHRRRSWLRRIFLGRDQSEEGEHISSRAAGPMELLEQKEVQQLVYQVLDGMSTKRRTVLVLVDVEGYSSEEIAGWEGVPDSTVRSRLFHARREFRAAWQKLEKVRDLR